MRIYELAQLKNVSSKEIIEKLQEAGFDVKNHMSVLDDEALSFLEKRPQGGDDMHQEIEENKSSVIPAAANAIASVLTPVVPEFVAEQMSVSEFAIKAKKPITDVIVTLLKWGIVSGKNHIIGQDIIERLARYYEIPLSKSVVKQELVHKARPARIAATGDNLKPRQPVVVVVGHVDHGKTTLLDYIRNTRVALKEKGGITQHLGAYEAKTSHGAITFLDTPGHEAFGKIRQRGVRVADIVILVVAADDGIMPQTVEAIKQAQAMNVPIVVAINKIDRVDQARIEAIKGQLNRYDLTPEDWGGGTICVQISAKLGTGVDQLLEMLALQAEMMELRADTSGVATGYVLESRMEKGRGPVATIISQSGTVHIGDYFSCGATTGHISSLVDSCGKRLKQVLPSVPVLVAGFDDLPEAGDFFEIVPKNEYLKIRTSGLKNIVNEKHTFHEGGINLVVKSDTHSSQEAIIDGLEKLSKKAPKGFNVLRHDIGDINESDVEFAFNTGAQIIGFNVKTESNAFVLADRRRVKITHYGIIYKLLEALAEYAESFRQIEMVRTKIGEASVLRVFDIKKVGVIAGCIVKDGRFTRDGYAIIWRGRSKIGEGKIMSLQRDKKTVKEIAAGFECGFLVDGFTAWEIDDRVECYINMPKK